MSKDENKLEPHFRSRYVLLMLQIAFQTVSLFVILFFLFGKSENRSSSKEYIHHKSSDFRGGVWVADMRCAYEIYIEKETTSAHTSSTEEQVKESKCGSNCFRRTEKESNIKHVIHKEGFLYARCRSKRKTFYGLSSEEKKKKKLVLTPYLGSFYFVNGGRRRRRLRKYRFMAMSFSPLHRFRAQIVNSDRIIVIEHHKLFLIAEQTSNKYVSNGDESRRLSKLSSIVGAEWEQKKVFNSLACRWK